MFAHRSEGRRLPLFRAASRYKYFCKLLRVLRLTSYKKPIDYCEVFSPLVSLIVLEMDLQGKTDAKNAYKYLQMGTAGAQTRAGVGGSIVTWIAVIALILLLGGLMIFFGVMWGYTSWNLGDKLAVSQASLVDCLAP